MKVLKCILVASLCMALSIPALAQSPVINDESGPQATPISEEERFSINPRGWYSFDASRFCLACFSPYMGSYLQNAL